MRGHEGQAAILITAACYLIMPPMTKGETVTFAAAIWLCAVLLIFGVEDQITRFKKRAKRRRLRAERKQKRPELADIRILRG